jgi:hypothetical protein
MIGPPRWLVWIALVGNITCSFVMLAERNALLWLIFTAFAAINIHSLIRGGRTTDPRKGSTP